MKYKLGNNQRRVFLQSANRIDAVAVFRNSLPVYEIRVNLHPMSMSQASRQWKEGGCKVFDELEEKEEGVVQSMQAY